MQNAMGIPTVLREGALAVENIWNTKGAVRILAQRPNIDIL